jgi:hypothetical protein
MSHVTAIRTVPIKDEEALRTAVEELGGTLERRNTYKWFGRSVGDYPLPKGIKVEDLGKCELVAKFPGINYEVGFAKVEGEEGLFPLFDFWGRSPGGLGHDGEFLREKIGEGAGILMQKYSTQAAINAAMSQGYMILGQTTDQKGNIHLELGIM